MSSELEIAVQRFIAERFRFETNIDCVHLALSGGVDSVVLLHLLAPICQQRQIKLVALHLHHGLSPNADSWLQFNQQLCAHYSVKLLTKQVKIISSGQGIENAARQQRYLFFAEVACKYLFLAHHANDQAETMLFRLCRGSGLNGLIAMQTVKQLTYLPDSHEKLPTPMQLWRPLLHISRQQIITYAESKQLSWIEDESNRDEKYSRNYLRQQIIPRLAQTFPSILNNLALSRDNLQESVDLIEEIATQDCQYIGEIFTINNIQQFKLNYLAIDKFLQLSILRQKNLIKYIISNRLNLSIDHHRLEQLIAWINSPASTVQDVKLNQQNKYSSWQIAKGNALSLIIWQNKIFFTDLAQLDKQYKLSEDLLKQINIQFSDIIKAYIVNKLNLNWQIKFNHGNLFLQVLSNAQQQSQSLAINSTTNICLLSRNKISENYHKLSLRFANSTDKIQIQTQRPAQKLKNLWQEKNIPPWLRDKIPLLCYGEQVIACPWLGTDSSWHSADSEQKLALNWQFNWQYFVMQ